MVKISSILLGFAASAIAAPHSVQTETKGLAERDLPTAWLRYTTAGQFMVAIGMNGMNGGIYDAITGDNGAQIIASQILNNLNQYWRDHSDLIPGVEDFGFITKRAYFDAKSVSFVITAAYNIATNPEETTNVLNFLQGWIQQNGGTASTTLVNSLNTRDESGMNSLERRDSEQCLTSSVNVFDYFSSIDNTQLASTFVQC